MKISSIETDTCGLMLLVHAFHQSTSSQTLSLEITTVLYILTVVFAGWFGCLGCFGSWHVRVAARKR
jgi:hypothetical protein